MQRALTLLALGAGANLFAVLPAMAQAAPEVTLTRFDCGTPPAPTEVNARFSDTYAYPGMKVQFVYSCYLIKHGDDYMMWDTGQATSAGAVAPKVPLVDLLAQMKVTPDQVKYVGISHFHGDHIGQANALPKSTLLIGTGDWDALTSAKPPTGVNPQLVSTLDQRRRHGRAGAAGQGRVRRRHRDHAVARPGTRPAITACWSSWRRWEAWC